MARRDLGDRASSVDRLTGPLHMNISLCSTILVVFLEFILVDRAEIPHMNTPQNSSRLPGSYEETLELLVLTFYSFNHPKILLHSFTGETLLFQWRVVWVSPVMYFGRYFPLKFAIFMALRE